MFLTIMPSTGDYLFESFIVLVSTAWLLKTWMRSPVHYSIEKRAQRNRKQLTKLELDTERYLDGRTIEDLTPSELHVLAKVLPEFTSDNAANTKPKASTKKGTDATINASSKTPALSARGSRKEAVAKASARGKAD